MWVSHEYLKVLDISMKYILTRLNGLGTWILHITRKVSTSYYLAE